MEVKRFGFFFLLGIILLVAFTFFRIIYDFFPSIAAGIILAYTFNPAYRKLHKWTGHRTVAAFGVIALVVTLIMVPLGVLLVAVQRQINTIFTENTIDDVRNLLQTGEDMLTSRLPFELPGNPLEQLIPKMLGAGQQVITSFGPKMLAGATGIVLSIFISLFLLYYLLIRSEIVISTFKDYFPVSYKNSDILLKHMGRDTRSVIFGQLLVAIIQGVLGGIGFLIFGLPGAILWGLVMTVTSFIPFLGAGIVWFPATVILIIQGSYLTATGFFLWSAIVVSSTDNIIRPKLTNALGELHPVTVLLGVFIGIKEWGFIGLVLGPLIISVLIILIKMFREEYIEE